MDKVEYNKSSHSLKYIYTFTKMAKSDNSEATWKLIEAVTRETLVAEFKSQPAIGQFRNDKLNLIFVCNDKNNVHLFTVMLKHGEY
ncbi:hypothetical protein E4O00_07740 [Treponema sp. OMZ 788]|nr:hypothetical protein [Treponema sp. OMZ 788]UTC63813.1 hypothetical protein E4O00_07740 [Treponema sp. OMZ 788]